MAGRPTDFKEEYCTQLIEHMGSGYSFESFAGLIGVARSTIYEWVDSKPEFSDAKKSAFEASRLWWERQGIEGLHNTTDYDDSGKPIKSKAINATLWIFNMKNRFREDWQDKQQVEQSGSLTINWNEEKTYETK